MGAARTEPHVAVTKAGCGGMGNDADQLPVLSGVAVISTGTVGGWNG